MELTLGLYQNSITEHQQQWKFKIYLQNTSSFSFLVSFTKGFGGGGFGMFCLVSHGNSDFLRNSNFELEEDNTFLDVYRRTAEPTLWGPTESIISYVFHA